MQFENWLAFCSIALLATVTPGPAAFLVSVNSLSVGFKKSLVTIFGNITGLFLMSAFSVLGLSAVILHSTVAFTTIKVLGAMYLIYIGLKLWRNGIGNVEVNKSHKVKNNILTLYVQGIIIALTNPKAIIFTTSLFPQFITVSEPLLHQFSVLVLSFIILSFLCLSSYSLLALRTKSETKRIVSENMLGKVFGSTFIGAGFFLATASK